MLFSLGRDGDGDRVTILLANEDDEGEKTGFRNWRRKNRCKIDSKSRISKKCVEIPRDSEFVKLYKEVGITADGSFRYKLNPIVSYLNSKITLMCDRYLKLMNYERQLRTRNHKITLR